MRKAEAELIRTQALEKATKTQRDLSEFVAATMAEQKRAMESAQSKEITAESLRAAAAEDRAAAAKIMAEAQETLQKANSARDAIAAAQAALGKL
jgi:hypothetical protein